jgi:hypothetical protein
MEEDKCSPNLEFKQILKIMNVQPFLRKVARRYGYDFYIKNLKSIDGNIQDPIFEELYQMSSPYTMTSTERMYALYNASKEIARRGIPGDIVECGVWKGGSTMMALLTMMKFEKNEDRTVYLYDTFEGMAEPTAIDVSLGGEKASNTWARRNKKDKVLWDYASLNEVKENMRSTGYPLENIKFIKGKVEDTIPKVVPEKIALLRLDTDWYESTKHELAHLYPCVVPNDIVIIDDYGYWDGCRKAVDEYLNENNINILMHRIDGTGRMFIKT